MGEVGAPYPTPHTWGVCSSSATCQLGDPDKRLPLTGPQLLTCRMGVMTMMIGSLGFSPLTWLLPQDPEWRSERTGWAPDKAPVLDPVNIFTHTEKGN